jgi:hypothetical protein
MSAGPINFAAKLAAFSEHWSPRVIAETGAAGGAYTAKNDVWV